MGSVKESVEEMRETFRTGKTRSEKWRRAQLKGLLSLVQGEEVAIFEALGSDLGKHPAEAFRDEVGVLIKSINLALSELNHWMSPKSARLPLVTFPASAIILPEPLGAVLLFSSWNFPIGLALEPMIGAIAAGNVVALKPSDLAPASAKFLADAIPRYLDGGAVRVFLGDQSVGSQLLEQQWDKIFFTGSPRVGRIVMRAAAEQLTPVILELGGKCPAVVDFLPPSSQEIDMLQRAIKRFFGDVGNLSRLVNRQHFMRLKGLLEDPEVSSSMVYGGGCNVETMKIEPTILLDPPLNSEIMTEEIFGPLLPIITLEKIRDSIKFIKERSKPLVIYAFTDDETLKQQILDETSSGSVTFNDTIIQFALDSLPFGGVGQSGFGRYHGKFSFDAFSHEKPVLRRHLLLDFPHRYPPWNDAKFAFLRGAFRYDYLSLLLILLGLKRS